MIQLPRIILVTGGMAAGKSTVAQILAHRLPKSVHLRGDVFRKMIVMGRADMTAPTPPEAIRQLELRYEIACDVAGRYADAGFTVVYQDVVLGTYLTDVAAMLEAHQPGIVVLAPPPSILASRDAARAKTGYAGGWTPEAMAEGVEDTPRLGLWIDNSTLTPDQTVDHILANMGALRVGLGG